MCVKVYEYEAQTPTKEAVSGKEGECSQACLALQVTRFEVMSVGKMNVKTRFLIITELKTLKDSLPFI